MDTKLKFYFPETPREKALACGRGSEGAAILKYMKEKGLPDVDFVLPDENFSSRDLTKYKLVFLAGGTSDLTASENTGYWGDITHSMNVTTIGLAALPYFSGDAENYQSYPAELESFKNEVDLLVVFSGDDLLNPGKENSFINLRKSAHEKNWLAAKTIMDMVNEKGVVCFDMDDVRYVAKKGGYGYFTTGQGSGENRVEMAVRMAMTAASIITDREGKAGNVLLYICYGPNEITMQEVEEILKNFQKAIRPQGEIFWNYGYNPDLLDDLRISAIWTGLEKLPGFVYIPI